VTEPITFLATIRPIQSALSVHGGGDGARLTLDIPETELPAIARLLMARGVRLRVCVEVLADEVIGQGETQVRAWNERRT
jgi:hypothetical protein